ncbi:MAG: aminopeptidase P family protein [Candidatus Rokubacteria bacterium]|nr:aminopeptidase P family protein [Candidatus Rokubacteria bacterium]
MYPHQAERLTQVLDREGLEALVATAPENIAYITGFRSLAQAIYRRTPHFAVFTRDALALVVPVIELPAVATEAGDLPHVLPYGEFYFEYDAQPGDVGRRIRDWATTKPHANAANALAAALERLAVRRGPLGLDDSALPFDLWHRASERLAPLRVVAAGSFFTEARSIKSPYEIECLERSLHLAEEAANAVIQMLEPGVTERQAVTLFQETVVKTGGAPYCSIIAFGDHTAIPAPAPRDRGLKAGELVRFEVGCEWKGYYSGVARTAILGQPTERQDRTYEAAQAGLAAAIDSIKPGVAAGTVFDAAIRAAREAGLPSYRRHHAGHATGLEPFEPPLLAAGEDTELQQAMVLRVEAPYYVIGWGGVTVMDTVLVTRGGARVMNRAARGLIALD